MEASPKGRGSHAEYCTSQGPSRRIPLHQCTESLIRTVKALLEINTDIRLIFTVSPYRYAKYGYHGSQLSKSVLLLAVESVCESFPDVCHYFPSYEILLDELRDYRF